ncbi:MAG: copper amine oxidase N-terminal domain-containing protein [Ruminococcaceae bacterium]|nr:copper amine oxidase N-terminal domain-containing protein [Oscillospiraceae bacterium]
MVINDQHKIFDVMPQIVDGRTLVPMRGIFEEFGAEIMWEQSTRTVTAKVGDKAIVLIVDNPVAKVNDADVTLDVAAQIVDGRTMVPVRFVAEALGCNVDWDGDTRTVIISGGDIPIKVGNMATSTYINDYTGIGFNLPEGWSFKTREEINQMYGIVADMMNTNNLTSLLEQKGSYLDMMASDPSGDNIQVTLNTSFGISEEAYCQQLVSSLAQQVASYGINVKNVTLANKNVIGAKLNGVQIESEYNGVNVYQLILVKNVGDYSILYTISSSVEANLDIIAMNLFVL